MKRQPIALITGVTGFIGFHLAQHLLHEGWRLHAIVRPSSKKKITAKFGKRIRIHVYDGSYDSVMKAIQQSQPQIVFHLASLFLAGHVPSDIDPLFESNLVFPTKLAEAMVAQGVRRLVNVGTAWQHYKNESYNPVNLYASTKQAFESILKYYCEAHNLKVSTIKIFDTFGTNDPRNKLVPAMIKAVHSKQSLTMSPGYQMIDLVYIDDVVSGLALAAKRLLNRKSVNWETFSINTHKPLTLRALISTFENAAGQKINIKWNARPYRPREVMTPWKGTRWIPGWKPKTGLKEGFKKLIAEYEGSLK